LCITSRFLICPFQSPCLRFVHPRGMLLLRPKCDKNHLGIPVAHTCMCLQQLYASSFSFDFKLMTPQCRPKTDLSNSIIWAQCRPTSVTSAVEASLVGHNSNSTS
jgi:hypothetical protein